MSKRKSCLMAGCESRVAARELCWTHYKRLQDFADLEVQAVIDEREREKIRERAAKLDWGYLTEDQRTAIEAGVKDAYFESGSLQQADLDNMLQDTWIWAASKKAEVQKIRTLTLLRERARSRIVEANRTRWRREAITDYFEDLLPRDEED